MDANLINISKVYEFFDGLLKNRLSKNIFYTNLPAVLNEKWIDMVRVDVVGSVVDNWGSGRGLVNIIMYAKPFKDGRTNTPHLDKMASTLNDLIANSNNEHYFISRNGTYSDYDEKRRLDIYVVSLILKIV